MGTSKSERVEIRLSTGELAAWRAAAPGGNVSRWLRDLAGRELAGKAGGVGPSVRRATVEEVRAEGGRVSGPDTQAGGSSAPATSAATRSASAPPPATPERAAPRTAAPGGPEPAPCAHPRDRRVVRRWGSMCGACGRLVR